MLAVMSDARSPSGPQSPRPVVVLDCDPGHDDAIAIVAAAHFTDLAGITTVAGNAPLPRTTHNALVMRDLLGIDVPVHSGADRPLVREPKFAPDVHGASGLDGADLPAPTTPLDGTDAARFIIDTVRSNDGIWLVPTGPLTNIALALRLAPEIADRIRGISLMGGGSFGNRTVMGEFNIWADPEAAHVVFDAGVPLTMAGLDVTHQFLATPARVDRVRALPGQLAEVLADLLVFFSATYGEIHDDGALSGGAVHDPLAVLAVTHPSIFESVDRRVDIETHGILTRGMTVIDERTVRARAAPNCAVLTTVDADAAFDLIHGAIAHYSR